MCGGHRLHRASCACCWLAVLHIYAVPTAKLLSCSFGTVLCCRPFWLHTKRETLLKLHRSQHDISRRLLCQHCPTAVLLHCAARLHAHTNYTTAFHSLSAFETQPPYALTERPPWDATYVDYAHQSRFVLHTAACHLHIPHTALISLSHGGACSTCCATPAAAREYQCACLRRLAVPHLISLAVQLPNPSSLPQHQLRPMTLIRGDGQ